MGIGLDEIGRLGASAQRQIMQQIQTRGTKPQNPSKMRNIVDYRGAIRFDSRKEARRYDELLTMLRAGEIDDLRLQHQITVQEAYTTPDGERIRAIRYVADFSYILDGRRVYEDAKGRQTDTYRLKKKLVRERTGIEIREV